MRFACSIRPELIAEGRTVSLSNREGTAAGFLAETPNLDTLPLLPDNGQGLDAVFWFTEFGLAGEYHGES